MFKVAIGRPRLYSRCIPRLHQSIPRRLNATLSSQLSRSLPEAALKQPEVTHDDRTLREVFDSPGFWKEFSLSAKAAGDGKNVGLFQNRYLTGPKGFEDFANTSLDRAKRIVAKVLAANTVEEYHQVVRQLDRLSDLLCRVIDLSDFVRATHPDPSIQAAATRAHSMMYEYMNVLNTTTGLAEQLDIAMKGGTAPWSEQEHMVAQILKRDFAKSAIDLSEGERERFVTLSQDINDIGSNFVDTMAPAKEHISFPSSQLKGMDPMLLRQITRWGQVTMPAVGGIATTALRSVEDPDVRKELFMANRTASRATIKKLELLLKKRADLAKLTGYESYGHVALEDKMAGNPDVVKSFLNGLSFENHETMRQPMATLLDARESAGFSGPMLPWDKEYYMAKVLASVRSKKRVPDFLSSYFSLGVTMQGLSRLFSRLYGIRFVPRETLPGETWNSDVRRLDVVSDVDGLVAVLYCDLFSRPGKSPNPAHFTLRCSRFIGNSEIAESQSNPNSLFSSPEQAANDGMAISRLPDAGGVMQLPTIALICDFATAEGPNTPALLSFHELTTLFHEMGHAIHSILGRTDFQNVSGTRCATDFAELPSVLMEHFAADESVLGLFARHYETDEPLPYKMVTDKLDFDKKFESFDVDNQIILSLLDQEVHSKTALNPSFSSTKIYHELQHKYSGQPVDPSSTCWQGFFGHLFGYGGSYYSYLLDRVLARRIWQKVFLSGHLQTSVSRDAGENFKNEVLQFGGAKEPWKMMASVLKDERLVENGSASAMKIAGTWGLQGRKLEEKIEQAVRTSRGDTIRPLSISETGASSRVAVKASL